MFNKIHLSGKKWKKECIKGAHCADLLSMHTKGSQVFVLNNFKWACGTSKGRFPSLTDYPSISLPSLLESKQVNK